MNFQKLDFLQSIHGTVHDAFSYTIPMLYWKVYEKHDTRFSVHESIHWFAPKCILVDTMAPHSDVILALFGAERTYVKT